MSNELLRIHDENKNCDLVAVANPMGNFHMSTYAEMQDGTQKPVDGWYLFSKMIEKLGQGGGGSGGVTVVNFDYDEEIHSIVADHTVSEVKSAVKTGIVIGRFDNSSYIAMRLDSVNPSDGIQVGVCFMKVAWDSSKSAYVLTPRFGIDKTDNTKWKDCI